ncbi:MAG: flagellar hook-basal body protein [Oscillospiraceae bacterium]|nr:flagellar hook-basal body protein [Oscillospiraceae bacterium]
MFGAKMTAATGLRHQQFRLDTIANNIANANTTGFRGSRVDFKDAMYLTGMVPGTARSPEGNQQRGHGVLVAATTMDFRSGSLLVTDRDLDFAVAGNGFFTLGDLDGNLFYTRNGAFDISVEDEGRFIVNANGLYLLDTNGERIMVPDNAQTISVDHAGTMRFFHHEDEFGLEEPVTIAIYMFRNKMGLYAAGDGVFTETVASGERFPADGEIVQGAVEGSNVNLSEQMTLMIRTQRAFQLVSRALTTADEMEALANNMRR